MPPFTYSSRREGAWAARPIGAGETIDQAPVVVLPAVQGRILAQTNLGPYLEEWPSGRGAIAMPLGSVGIYRRGPDANAHLVKRGAEMAIDVVATRDIDDGEEIVVSERPPTTSLRASPLWSNRAIADTWRWGLKLRKRAGAVRHRR